MLATCGCWFREKGRFPEEDLSLPLLIVERAERGRAVETLDVQGENISDEGLLECGAATAAG